LGFDDHEAPGFALEGRHEEDGGAVPEGFHVAGGFLHADLCCLLAGFPRRWTGGEGELGKRERKNVHHVWVFLVCFLQHRILLSPPPPPPATHNHEIQIRASAGEREEDSGTFQRTRINHQHPPLIPIPSMPRQFLYCLFQIIPWMMKNKLRGEVALGFGVFLNRLGDGPDPIDF